MEKVLPFALDEIEECNYVATFNKKGLNKRDMIAQNWQYVIYFTKMEL